MSSPGDKTDETPQGTGEGFELACPEIVVRACQAELDGRSGSFAHACVRTIRSYLTSRE